ncbi:MAG: methyltransferase [Sulfurovum sp. AS07-7]|nr:MAG: methyltransferase [Sulfurovum sp. AS07-7]TQV63657.1 MAG: methyltransferase [Sulfurovum sp.]
MFLYQPTSGYAYNSDSIFLYQFIHKFKPFGRLLDVGCGVGIISLLLSRDFKITTNIIDKQKIMLKYAKHNFEINGLEVEAHEGDFIDFKEKDKFNFIVSNPPFYHNDVTKSQNEHLHIARYAQHLPLDKFIAKVKKLLAPRGWFIFCYDAKQLSEILVQMHLNKITPQTIQFVHSKKDRASKLVMVAGRLNSKSLLEILEPFIVFDNESNYNTEPSNAFKMASTHSIKGDF